MISKANHGLLIFNKEFFMEKNQLAFNDREAAEYLGVSVQTMRNWRHIQKGPVYHKIERRVIYRAEDLKAFLDKNRVDPEKADSRAN